MMLSRSSRRTLFTCAFTLVSTALLAGCGGDPVNPNKPAPACPTATLPEPTTLSMDLTRTLALGGSSIFYLGTVTASGSVPTDGLGALPIDGGSPTLVSAEAGNATSLAAEGSTSYYASGSVIVRDTLGGGMSETIYISMDYDVQKIALDATSYYVTLRNTSGGANAILRGPKSGGAASIIVTLPSSSPIPRDFRVDGKNLYFVTIDGAIPTTTASLWRAPVEGGDPIELVHSINPTSEIAIDDTSVYYFTTAFNAASLMKVAKEGGAPVELLAGLNVPHGLAVTNEAIYVTEVNPPDGGGDSTGESQIYKVPRNGECTTMIASKQTVTRSSYRTLVADETSVYWGTDHGIKKLAR